MTTHEDFLSNIENLPPRIVRCPCDGSLRTLVSVPLFHVTGCNSQLLPTLRRAAARPSSCRPSTCTLSCAPIAAERINSLIIGAGDLLAGDQPAEFRASIDTSRRALGLLTAARRSRPTWLRRIIEAFPHARVGNGFGLTETSSVATFLPHEYARLTPTRWASRPRSCDLKLDGRTARAGIGELLVRGPNIVKGYWNKPEATAETFVDGWLHTGDLARIDDEGFVQIVDRKKDMINRGGENVYCVEVENALAGAPGVFEVGGAGRARRDDGRESRRGDRPGARQLAWDVARGVRLPQRPHSPTSRSRSTSRSARRPAAQSGRKAAQATAAGGNGLAGRSSARNWSDRRTGGLFGIIKFSLSTERADVHVHPKWLRHVQPG